MKSDTTIIFFYYENEILCNIGMWGYGVSGAK
jgi:hypothetical protein